MGLFLSFHLNFTQRLEFEEIPGQFMGIVGDKVGPDVAMLSIREARLVVSPIAV